MTVIGVTCGEEETKVFLEKAYFKALQACGAVPVLLPPSSEGAVVARYCGLSNGILLTGGADLDPFYFGEEPRGTRRITPERDAFEILLVQKALELNKPLFAICRGLQVLNVAAGGDIYQDLAVLPEALDHWQRAPATHSFHRVEITPGSLLFRFCGQESLRVNSFHHQAVKHLAPGFLVSARALDRTVEAIEAPLYKFILGVQWHPEALWEQDKYQHSLFQGFVAAASEM